MLKDITISILGAMVLSGHPWFSTVSRGEKITIVMGLSVILFIFLLFLEETVKKVQRVRNIRRILKRLQGGEVGRNGV